ncbi:tRNA uracil 4-sulfurtransferase ThiI [Spirochaeta isovalerica]|uniref:Probable tRNA sulfurtransferase n=1 Tax=Spirochaeta isovalerica TaxID=150 RepID=A0A841REI9_9SPIO|nr:tRNA uracil 4-sulfurtransferase ThiI [Spirochaeta isovalerica]MBB6480762.1 thiamine biosynthesis protein ThiI [Spirochaeta isovalerica]
MKDLYLIKIGEISLKKGNRKIFEKQLKDNIKKNLKPYGSHVNVRSGRFYLEVEDVPEEVVTKVLASTFGIVGFYKTHSCAKELEPISELAISLAKQNLASGYGNKFKVETRRVDKSLPMDSYDYSREIGGMIFEAVEGLEVDVRNPDWVIHVELREKAYVYGYGVKGPGGLPVSTAGRGTLLLSGGIDSPVAGYLMAKRGLKLDAVYFHTPPYTSNEAHEKVKELAKILAPWCSGINLFSVPFTDVQVKVNQSVEPSFTTLHARAAMMTIAEKITKERDGGCLITGEALSQVASQTMESLAFTNSSVTLPVFRPLIGMDKEEIIKISRKLGAFETSTLPYDDCCAMFAPQHPETRPDFEKTREMFNNIDFGDLLDQAVANAERTWFPATGND